jgi:hypothetical protein
LVNARPQMRHLLRLPFAPQTCAGDDRSPAGDYPLRAEHADAVIDDVHRAALAPVARRYEFRGVRLLGARPHKAHLR